MPDDFEHIKAILGVANQAVKERRSDAAAAALAEAQPLLAARIAQGSNFSASVTTQASLLSVLAGRIDIAQHYAELVVAEVGPMLETLCTKVQTALAGDHPETAQPNALLAYVYTMAFIPFVAGTPPVAALESLAPSDDPQVAMLLIIQRQVRPQLDAAGWSGWPYTQAAAVKARYWAAQSLVSIGSMLLDNLGSGRDADDAQGLARTSIALLHGLPPDQLLADALNLAGRVLQRYGLRTLPDAIPFFEQAIAVQEGLAIPNLVDAAVDHSNLGAIYLSIAAFDAANNQATDASEAAAEQHLNSAITTLRTNDPFRRLPGALSNLCALYSDQKRWDDAFKAGNEAWTLVSGDARYDADVRMRVALNVAATFAKQARYTDATEWYRKALDAGGSSAVDPETAIATRGGLGAALLQTDGAESAMPYLQGAVDALEGFRTSFLSEQPNVELLKRLEWIYEAYIGACERLGQTDSGRRHAAFDAAERIKWRTLTAELRFRPLELPGLDADKALVDEEQALLSFLQPVILGAASNAQRTPRIAAALARLEQIWNALEARHPEFVAIRRQQTATVADVAAVLDDDVPVLVEYFIGTEYGAAFAFIVRRGEADPHLIRLDATSDGLRTLVATLRGYDAKTPLATFNATLNDLHTAVLAPVLPFIEDGAGVCFVPYGVLHNVPFAALYDGAQYCVERNAPVVAASATALRWWVRKDRSQRRRCLIFTATSGVRGPKGKLPDLPLFEELARRSIAPLFAGSSVIGGATATKERLLAELAADTPWDVAHLACHGIFRTEGFDAFLVLAPNPDGTDANLSALEIASAVRPDTSLVTLSACDSGIAQTSTGDEVAGLAHAFLLAGSSSVIASLWLVRQDAGVAVTQRFYHEWLRDRDAERSTTKIRSLQTAQCQILHKKGWFGLGADFSHPYLWAAFQLYGSWT